MDINYLAMLLMALQPFIIYYTVYKPSEKSKSDNEFHQSFITIPPSFSFFYFEQFGYAFAILTVVALLGIALSQIIRKTAGNAVEVKSLLVFGTAWFCNFGIGYTIISFFSGVSDTSNSSEVATPLLSLDSVFSALGVSLCMFIGVIIWTLSRALEVYKTNETEFSDLLIMPFAALGGFSPVFGDYFIISLLLNFCFIFAVSKVSIEAHNDPSMGGVGFFYMYLFMMGAGGCVLVKLGMFISQLY